MIDVKNVIRKNWRKKKRIGGGKMKCSHCKEELGEGDSYDLMKAHIHNCNSKIGMRASASLMEDWEDKHICIFEEIENEN